MKKVYVVYFLYEPADNLVFKTRGLAMQYIKEQVKLYPHLIGKYQINVWGWVE